MSDYFRSGGQGTPDLSDPVILRSREITFQAKETARVKAPRGEEQGLGEERGAQCGWSLVGRETGRRRLERQVGQTTKGC